MRTTYDGFEIAEKDLILRGPGDFFSSVSSDNLRQSGGFEFKFASSCDSSELFATAFSAAKSIIQSDPTLSLPVHEGLRREVESKIKVESSTIS
jgi:ATP-dependent DNA helicase RecG